MKTTTDSWNDFRKAVESKQVPRALNSAFAAGMRAAVDILTDPFSCPVCVERLRELAKEIDSLEKSGGQNGR